MSAHVFEYWRSRLFPKELVYWRYVMHRGGVYTPECGSPKELAGIILDLRARYGYPQRDVRAGRQSGKEVRRLIWARVPGKFVVCPVAFVACARD